MRPLGRVSLYLITALFVSTSAQSETLLTWTETIGTSEGNLSVPVEMYLTAHSETRLDIKLAVNLGSLQRKLPGMLSEIFVNTCEERVGVEISEARAEGDHVRVTGRAQLISFSCNKAQEFDSRVKLVSTIVGVEALLHGTIRGPCLNATVADLELKPIGVIGGILNLTGLTDQITAEVRSELTTALNDADSCLDLPEPLKAIETDVLSGGFRDFGDGKMGVVIKATSQTKAENIIRLYSWLDEEGLLDGECDCEEAK